MLRFSRFSLSYGGEKILNEIELDFKEGQISVITGCSGSGKSTVLKLINGIIPDITEAETDGDIVFTKDGVSESLMDKSIEDRSMHISTVFQNPKNQFYTINSTDEMAFALENRNIPRDEIFSRIDYYTSILDTKKLLDKDIFKLSGGEKQMVAITSVACMNQDIYIFDEPSSSLDSEHIERLRNALIKLKELGKTVIVAEHRLFYLNDIIDKMYILENKKAIELSKSEINRENIEKHGLRNINRINKEELVKGEYRRKMIFDKSYNPEAEMNLLNCKYGYKGESEVFNMNLSIGGDITFILGENGIGKTTFVRCLCKLNRGFRGKTCYKCKIIKNPRDRISLVMQDVNYQLFTESVWSEISIVSNDDEKKERVLRELGLYEKRDAHPHSLSGGEKQRLSIALCKASNKPIVIFDEPTSGLCKKNMKRIIDLIHGMKRDGKKIIIVTHDYEFIKECGGEMIEFVRE